jgi:carbamate kinase
LVVALGGHAIVPHGAAGTAEQQVATIERAMGEVAALVSEGSDVVVTHGNGPQVGNLPSPEPIRSLEADTVRMLLDAGAVVIANGGGGVPMVEDDDGRLVGADAVVDKDLAAALLAVELGADRLAILTDVEGVAVDFGGPRQRWLDGVGTVELRELAAKGTFGVGSMAPKVEAGLRFVEATGHPATIGPLERAADVLHGRSGTRVTRSGATVGAG